jgi:hypothetical protein
LIKSSICDPYIFAIIEPSAITKHRNTINGRNLPPKMAVLLISCLVKAMFIRSPRSNNPRMNMTTSGPFCHIKALSSFRGITLYNPTDMITRPTTIIVMFVNVSVFIYMLLVVSKALLRVKYLTF